MKGALISTVFGLITLLPAGLVADIAGANPVAINQHYNQVKANNSWAKASFPVKEFTGYRSLHGNSQMIGGDWVFNRGINIGAKEGSSVHTWLDGKVNEVGYNKTCGIFVVIKSGDWTHKYCYLKGRIEINAQGESYLVDTEVGIRLKPGVAVKAGKRLGRVGIPAYSSEPQLYWEVRYQNQWVDPADVIQLTQTQQRFLVPKQPVVRTPQKAVHQVVALRRAIIGQESNGDFRVVNRDSGALGYGQVMPFNVPSWSQEALGYSLTPEQFLANADLQLQIIEHRLTKYWRECLRLSGGNEAIAVRMVASYWYSGDPTIYDNPKPQPYNGQPYPSIRDYTVSVWQRYQSELAYGISRR